MAQFTDHGSGHKTNTLLILWCRPKQLPYDLSLLEKTVLVRLDGTGGKVRGRELWHGRGAVIMVVRRPG